MISKIQKHFMLRGQLPIIQQERNECISNLFTAYNVRDRITNIATSRITTLLQSLCHLELIGRRNIMQKIRWIECIKYIRSNFI